MYELVLLTAVLIRDHPAEFKVAWGHAKARAQLWDEFRHGRNTDDDAFWAEFFKHLTHKEQEEFLEGARQRAKVSEQRIREHEQALKRAEDLNKQIQEKLSGKKPPPPKPPDM